VLRWERKLSGRYEDAVNFSHTVPSLGKDMIPRPQAAPIPRG
jgi:hypothetical protein